MTTVVVASSSFLDPVTLIGYFGTWALVGLLLVVFVEAGVIFPLLPGDTLLFVAGMIAAGSEDVSRNVGTPPDFRIWQLLVLVPLAAFLGAQLGYLIGRLIGTSMFTPDARLLKQRYLDEAHGFFEQRGPSAIIITRFVPIIRTLVPLTAGAAKMNYVVFTAYNLVGAAAWGAGLPLLGYGLGQFAIVQRLLEPLFVLVGLASIAPMLIEWLKRRREAKNSAGDFFEATDGVADDDG
jgi:membrane-associated protein